MTWFFPEIYLKDYKVVMRFMQGRLVLGDGSIYDGMWRYGKRSGSGTFYFSNGDVFQGSWRDDVMHGKVCLFHSMCIYVHRQLA